MAHYFHHYITFKMIYPIHISQHRSVLQRHPEELANESISFDYLGRPSLHVACYGVFGVFKDGRAPDPQDFLVVKWQNDAKWQKIEKSDPMK